MRLEAELAGLGLHVDLANHGDVAGDGQLEISDHEPVELGDADPTRVVLDGRRPVTDRRLFPFRL